MALRPVTPLSKFAQQRDLIRQADDSGQFTNTRLYDHQLDAARKIANSTNRTELVVLPTGTGKSGICVLASYFRGCRNVLVITPSRIISRQMYSDFRHDPVEFPLKVPFLERVGIFGADYRTSYMPSGRLIQESTDVLTSLYDELIVVNAQKFLEHDDSKVHLDQITQQFDLVLIDEAHHYPAPTWERIVDHFGTDNNLVVFLTATPYNRGQPILDVPPLVNISLTACVARRVIRQAHFYDNFNELDEGAALVAVIRRMQQTLEQHDTLHPAVEHQAMILAQYKHSAQLIADQCNALGISAVSYVSGTPYNVLETFNNGGVKVLVVVGRLIEGYDNPRVSVGCIVRNVGVRSRVLFSQFVGRTFRIVREPPGEPANLYATIISHPQYNQRRNWDSLNQLAEEDPQDDYDN